MFIVTRFLTKSTLSITPSLELPTTVETNVQVNGTNLTDGYTTPVDLDSNGTVGFLQTGVAPSILSRPKNIIVVAGAGPTY